MPSTTIESSPCYVALNKNGFSELLMACVGVGSPKIEQRVYNMLANIKPVKK